MIRVLMMLAEDLMWMLLGAFICLAVLIWYAEKIDREKKEKKRHEHDDQDKNVCK